MTKKPGTELRVMVYNQNGGEEVGVAMRFVADGVTRAEARLAPDDARNIAEGLMIAADVAEGKEPMLDRPIAKTPKYTA